MSAYLLKKSSFFFERDFQIDLIENRYLLSGASDGSVSTFDTQYTTDYEGGGLIGKHKPLFVIDRHCGGHKYAVSSVSWYPVDTGLFVTGSYDHYVKVWDTNSTKVFLLSSYTYSNKSLIFTLFSFC